MKKILFLTFSLVLSLHTKAQVYETNSGAYPYFSSIDLTLGVAYQLGNLPSYASILDNYPKVSPLNPNWKKNTSNDHPTPTLSGNTVYRLGLEWTHNIHMSNISYGSGVFFSYQTSTFTQPGFCIQLNNAKDSCIQYISLSHSDNEHNFFNEYVTFKSINIPLLLKYRHKLAHKTEIEFTGGILVNIQSTKSYRTNAKFDFEAKYYHNRDTLFLMQEYINTNLSHTPTDPNTLNYFAAMQKSGYNVGLGVAPENSTGTTDYPIGTTLGYFFRLQTHYHYSPRISFLLGISLSQQFNGNLNKPEDIDLPLTTTITQKRDNHSDYNSITKGLSGFTDKNLGINVGMRFIFRHQKN